MTGLSKAVERRDVDGHPNNTKFAYLLHHAARRINRLSGARPGRCSHHRDRIGVATRVEWAPVMEQVRRARALPPASLIGVRRAPQGPRHDIVYAQSFSPGLLLRLGLRMPPLHSLRVFLRLPAIRAGSGRSCQSSRK